MSNSENPKAILQKICSEKDPKHWAPTFTNFLLRHPLDAELAEYAKNLIFYRMLLEGSESNLSSMVSYPVSVDGASKSGFLEFESRDEVSVYLPANQVFGSTSPVRECFIKALEDWLGRDFSLSKKLEKIESLIEAYINIRSEPRQIDSHNKSNRTQKKLRVGMLPYHDTLMIPLLLEAVNESTKKFTIDFDLHYFPDVSDNLKARNLHINFLSESRIDDMPPGKFSKLREENTKIVLLTNKKSSLKDIRDFYNYQGYYVQTHALTLLKGSLTQASAINIKNITNTESATSFYEREIDVLLALAAGLFNKTIAVIPSIQGYLWSKDTGLHFEENLGGTLVHHNLDPSTSNRNGSDDKFGIMVLGDNNEANELAVHLTDMAKELHKKFTKCLREGASKDKAAALLLTPILTRYPEYSGLLTNISSQLLTRMLEVESAYADYKPDWFCNKQSCSRAVSK